MNIFYLAYDPWQSAHMQCDKHVVKMSTETAQMVSTAMRLLFPKITENDTTLYKVSYPKHPCNLWARKSYQNLLWLMYHGTGLCTQYTLRYGREHASRKVIIHAADMLTGFSTNQLMAAGLSLAPSTTPRPLCMPDQYKSNIIVDSDGCAVHDLAAVEAYRRFYKGEKSRFAKWKEPSKAPDWWTDVGVG